MRVEERKQFPSKLRSKMPDFVIFKKIIKFPFPITQHLEEFSIPPQIPKTTWPGSSTPWTRFKDEDEQGSGGLKEEGALGLTGARSANKGSPICSEAAADCREGRSSRRYMRAPM